MFKSLFSKNTFLSETGVFKIYNSDLIPINEIPGNGSINSFINIIGFDLNQVHIIHDNNFDAKISSIGVKTFTKTPVIVFAKDKSIKLNISDVRKYIDKIDWEFEYSPISIESLLDSGIESQTFNIEFLDSVISLNNTEDKFYFSPELELYLQFNDEKILTNYVTSNLESTSTRYLRGLNNHLLDMYLKEAQLFHDNELDIYEEVNNQTEALLNIPDAVNNEYIELHRNDNNLINFYNLFITHYSKSISEGEFLFMNKGRYKQIDYKLYLIGRFIYKFDNNDELINIQNI